MRCIASVALVILAFVHAPISAFAQSASAMVSGTALYLEDVEMPAGALLEAMILDDPDAAPRIVGFARVEVGTAARRIPIPFSVPYDPAKIDPARAYYLQVRVLLDDSPIFETRDIYHVLTKGTSDRLDVLLKRAASRSAPTPLGSLPASFVGDFSCAGCPRVTSHLSLFPAGMFRIRLTVEGSSTAVYEERGSWEPARSNKVLRLNSINGRSMMLGIYSTGELVFLDAQAYAISSLQDHKLRRLPVYQHVPALPPSVGLRGTIWKTKKASLAGTMISLDHSTVIFSAKDNRLSVYGTSVSISGKYSATDELLGIDFETGRTTQMPCFGCPSTKHPLRALLSRIERYLITGKTLELRDATGRTLVLLEASGDRRE